MTDLFLDITSQETELTDTLTSYVVQKNLLKVLTSVYSRPLILKNVEEICECFWNYIVELYLFDSKYYKNTPLNVLDFPKVIEIVQEEIFAKTYRFIKALDF